MSAARAILLALLLGWVFPALSPALSPALADVAVPPLVGRVVDQTGTLSAADADALQQSIRAFEARKGSQIAVLIVPTTASESIEQFSIRVAQVWKVGRRQFDDGVLLVIAKNDRHLRIEVGYGLEGALTDVTSKRIIDEIITPRFKNGDFASGISAGVNRIMRVIEGEKLPAPVQAQPAPQQGLQPTWLLEHVNPFNPFVIFAVFVTGAILRGTLGRLIGSIATGGLVAVLAWFFIGLISIAILAGLIVFVIALFGDFSGPAAGSRGRGRSSDSWSGGGGGYSGSSSSSDSSSSSSSDSGGGGGSFGGGGASGSW
jgi:uncharacterized protein